MRWPETWRSYVEPSGELYWLLIDALMTYFQEIITCVTVVLGEKPSKFIGREYKYKVTDRIGMKEQ